MVENLKRVQTCYLRRLILLAGIWRGCLGGGGAPAGDGGLGNLQKALAEQDEPQKAVEAAGLHQLQVFPHCLKPGPGK